MALFLIAASVVGLAVTADRSRRTALSGGFWTSYPPGQPIPKLRCTVTASGDGTTISCPSRTGSRSSFSGVDVIGHTPATVAVSGRVLCVRRLGGQVFLSTGACGP
jgi:hypothetical protein